MTSAEIAGVWKEMGLAVAVVIIYFLPWITAGFRNTRNRSWVAFLNVFLGFTIIGWFIALIMASEGEQR